MLRKTPLPLPDQKNKIFSNPPTPAPTTLYHPFSQKNPIHKFDFFEFCGIFICRSGPAWPLLTSTARQCGDLLLTSRAREEAGS